VAQRERIWRDGSFYTIIVDDGRASLMWSPISGTGYSLPMASLRYRRTVDVPGSTKYALQLELSLVRKDPMYRKAGPFLPSGCSAELMTRERNGMREPLQPEHLVPIFDHTLPLRSSSSGFTDSVCYDARPRARINWMGYR